MDTLIIIRKIREAEVLADQGKHGDARKTLEPLLGEQGLSDNQRNLLVKKIDLFDKQKDRATRMMSRKDVAVRADDSRRGDTTIADFPRAKPSDRRPTGDTTVPGLPAVAPSTPTVALPRPGTRVGISPPSPPRMPAATSGDLQPLVAEDDETDAENEMFATIGPPSPIPFDPHGPTVAPPEPKSSVTAREEPVRGTSLGGITAREEAVSPASITARDQPVAKTGSITARDEPVPNLPPPPPPGPRTSEAAAQAARSTGRVGSPPDVAVQAARAVSPEAQSSTKRPTGAIRAAMGKSSAELRAIAAQLPANDISRDLALEVARLKDEIDRLTSERHGATPGAKPESGVFKIPMSSANTVVRTAAGNAGNTDISVTMPSRSDNAPDLEVLRPGKVRKTEQVSLSPAQTIEEAGQAPGDAAREDKLRQFAMLLAILVIVGLIGYVLWWGLQALSPAPAQAVTVTEAAAGNLRLGQDYKGHPAIAKPILRQGLVVDEASGWIAQLDPRDVVTAVVVPVGGKTPLNLRFEQRDFSPLGEPGVREVIAKCGEPVRPYDEAVFAKSPWGVLRYESRQGTTAIEFIYRTSSDGNHKLAWLRLVDLKVDPALPELK
ncbi:MAG: hypothetical protein IT462_14765 [Planctomycetes bacterium]|nr:hypothetical protein [Planctomycetota bacterium]